jgi:hypothetical protein
MLLKVVEAETPPPPLPLLPIALRQLPAAEEWELQNESYVSNVAVALLCTPGVPTDDVTGPGAVGMSNVLDVDDVDDDDKVEDDIDEGRKDERGCAFGGCVDVSGAGFWGEEAAAAGAGERGCRLDVGRGAIAGGGTEAGAGVSGDTSPEVEAEEGGGAGEDECWD